MYSQRWVLPLFLDNGDREESRTSVEPGKLVIQYEIVTPAGKISFLVLGSRREVNVKTIRVDPS